MTAEGLFNISKGFNDLMKALTPTPEMLIDIGTIAQGVGSVLSIIGQVKASFLMPFNKYLSSVSRKVTSAYNLHYTRLLSDKFALFMHPLAFLII